MIHHEIKPAARYALPESSRWCKNCGKWTKNGGSCPGVAAEGEPVCYMGKEAKNESR